MNERTDLVFAAATIDCGASAKDEMGHRADAGLRRPDRLLFDPLMLDGIEGDRVCFRMLEPVICGNTGKHIGIPMFFAPRK